VTTTTTSDVPMPAGTETYAGWEHHDMLCDDGQWVTAQHRIVWGQGRTVDVRPVTPHGVGGPTHIWGLAVFFRICDAAARCLVKICTSLARSRPT